MNGPEFYFPFVLEIAVVFLAFVVIGALILFGGFHKAIEEEPEWTEEENEKQEE